ncbi:hypothetical protein [Aeromonas jandaei]|uniref:hypothetical protein n=1 Tax=Aeromonas jandaei TaxID=650 RepID=UPI002B059822|nr:hypothetical protein [Aeromonas jandaei]
MFKASQRLAFLLSGRVRSRGPAGKKWLWTGNLAAAMAFLAGFIVNFCLMLVSSYLAFLNNKWPVMASFGTWLQPV